MIAPLDQAAISSAGNEERFVAQQRGDGSPDDAAGEHIGDERDIGEPGSGRDIGAKARISVDALPIAMLNPETEKISMSFALSPIRDDIFETDPRRAAGRRMAAALIIPVPADLAAGGATPFQRLPNVPTGPKAGVLWTVQERESIADRDGLNHNRFR